MDGNRISNVIRKIGEFNLCMRTTMASWPSIDDLFIRVGEVLKTVRWALVTEASIAFEFHHTRS
jgi:hypothetical protein